jgi:hypothetical protein
LLKQEVADLRGANSRFAVGNRAQKNETDALHKRSDELAARFGQAQSRSDDTITRILQEFETLRKQNHAPPLGTPFSFNNRGEAQAGGAIWELMAQSGEAPIEFWKRACGDGTPR